MKQGLGDPFFKPQQPKTLPSRVFKTMQTDCYLKPTSGGRSSALGAAKAALRPFDQKRMV